MKKLIVIMMMAALAITSMAETIQEGRKLHPKANFFYCKKKTYGENEIPPMSPIERVAWDGLDFYIKFYGQDGELDTRIDGTIQDIGDWHYFPLVIGGIGINIQDEKLAYFNLSGDIEEVFELDIKKTSQSSNLREW